MAGWTAVSGCDSWQADGWIIAQRRDGFQAHVACALHGPLIILFEQQGTDEPDDGCLVGEDADHVAAPFDLAVEAFERVGNWYEDRGACSSGWDMVLAYGATIRDEGHRSTSVGRPIHRMSRELVLVAGRLCDLPGCAESADP